MFKGWLLSCAFILAWLTASSVVVRMLRPRRRILTLVFLSLPVPLFYAWAYYATPSNLWLIPQPLSHTPKYLGLINGLAALALLGVNAVNCYFHFNRSIQIRLLREIEAAGECGLALWELRQRYGGRRVIGRRLTELVRYGLAHRNGFNYHLTNKGILLAKFLASVRAVFPIEAVSPDFPES